MATFRGRMTTTGKSEAIRFDKGLFRSMTGFRRSAQVRAHVIGPSTFLVTLDEAPEEAAESIEQDPVVGAYLDFLERDMREHPARLAPITEAEIVRLDELTAGVTASDEDKIPDDVTL